MNKSLISGIYFKVFVLILFIYGIVAGISTVSTLSVDRLITSSNLITKSEVPRLGIVSDILKEVVLADLHSSYVLRAERSDAVDAEKTRVKFEESVFTGRVFLDALAWGSESETFRLSQNGESYRKWQELRSGQTLIVVESSPELARLAGEANLYLTGYKNNTRLAHEAHEAALRFASEGRLEEAKVAAEQAIFYENKSSFGYLLPLNETLERIEVISDQSVKNEIATANFYAEEARVNILWVTTLGIVLLLVGCFFGVYFYVARPIKQLTTAVEATAQGDLTKRVEVTTKDELGRLADAFNTMSDKLSRSYDSLENRVQEKTSELTEILTKFEEKNKELERSQVATINLLEDLEEEKTAIERKVKERTKQIEHEKSKLLQVTGNMRGGAILLNEAKEVVFSNEKAYNLLGVSAKDSSSEHVLDAFSEYFSGEEIKAQMERCFAKESFNVPEIIGGGKVYEIFFHYIHGTDEMDESATGYFILFYDITEAKLLERSKSELVAVASHQLRTPLTAMRGNVEMLVDESYGPLNKDQHELLDDIEVSTIRLITMVNEMLDITKIERGDLEMTLERLSVKEILSSVADDLRSYARRHEFEISLNGVSEDLFVNGDKLRVRQVFQNLIDNAIKYSSHPGKLEISATSKDSVVEVTFKDNGIGVPQNEQSRLFDRFYRASNTVKTASSGSGLGLYIVKSIAVQLGGDIRFTSEEGVGTTFFVELPAHT